MPRPDHAAKIRRIVEQLRAHDSSKPVSLRKAGVSHQVPKSGDLRHRDAKIDVSDLTSILSIDPITRTCVAESGVTFVDLVTETMKYGLVPIVVPELKTITIGGAVSGCSIESMSFVHGGFHDTCLEYEIVTATGDVLIVTPTVQPLVFQMIHGSFGTLGILARLTFELVPAKEYVHLVHEKYATLAAYQAAIRRHIDANDVDFIDGIIHSPKLFVLCVGRFVAHAPYAHAYDWVRVYYQSTAILDEDYLRTPDYFFRYDRGVTNVRPKSLAGRILFGRLLASTEWLAIARKVHWALPKEKPTVTLDVFVPESKIPAFFEWYDATLNHYPLWMVPYKRVHDYEWMADDFWANNHDDMFLDIAIYGMKQDKKSPHNAHRQMEQKLRELGGIKTLISHNYYPEDEFWQIFNRKNYDAVKAITDPNNVFRDLYTKTCKAAMGLT